MNYLLGTDGILDMEGNLVPTPFDNKLVHHGIYHTGKKAVIVDRHQIWIHDNTWQHLLTSENELKCLLYVNGQLLVGTEHARLAWVDGETLSYIETFDMLDNRDQWSTPWGGPPNVRSLSLGPTGSIYVNIHVGWIARSLDGGNNWMSVTSGLHKDVHQIAAHPSKEEIVAAATAAGFHISQNSASSFERRWGKQLTYQRAVTWFPDTDIVLASVSSGPSGGNTELYRSNSLGHSWEKVDLPAQPRDNINTYQMTLTDDGLGFIIVNYSTICKTTDYGKSWKIEIDDLPKTYQVLSCN